MPDYAEQIARMTRQLEELKARQLQENGRKFDILWDWMTEEDKQRFFDDHSENREIRVLFGLEAPEMPRRRGGERPATSGGDLVCPICGKGGLTERGLKLHTRRVHKGVEVDEEGVPT